MSADINFDRHAERFQKNIYASAKGDLRLALCWRELQQHLPELAGLDPLDVWDAGGGLGQMSGLIAQRNHRVLLSDISAKMLSLAAPSLQSQGVSTGVKTVHDSIQNLAGQPQYQANFDIVVCHAVLEWVESADEIIASLVATLRPGGALSLMFYNVNALILGNMTKGNLYKLRDQKFAGHPGGLTPPSPRCPRQVEEIVRAYGLTIEARRGIRIAYDLMPRATRDQRSIEDVMAVEWQYGATDPFWALGRYVHYLCRKPLSDS